MWIRPFAAATLIQLARDPTFFPVAPPTLSCRLLFVVLFSFWEQLLKLAAHADFSEEAGRRRLVTLLQNLLVVRTTAV